MCVYAAVCAASPQWLIEAKVAAWGGVEFSTAVFSAGQTGLHNRVFAFTCMHVCACACVCISTFCILSAGLQRGETLSESFITPAQCCPQNSVHQLNQVNTEPLFEGLIRVQINHLSVDYLRGDWCLYPRSCTAPLLTPVRDSSGLSVLFFSATGLLRNSWSRADRNKNTAAVPQGEPVKMWRRRAGKRGRKRMWHHHSPTLQPHPPPIASGLSCVSRAWMEKLQGLCSVAPQLPAVSQGPPVPSITPHIQAFYGLKQRVGENAGVRRILFLLLLLPGRRMRSTRATPHFHPPPLIQAQASLITPGLSDSRKLHTIRAWLAGCSSRRETPGPLSPRQGPLACLESHRLNPVSFQTEQKVPSALQLTCAKSAALDRDADVYPPPEPWQTPWAAPEKKTGCSFTQSEAEECVNINEAMLKMHTVFPVFIEKVPKEGTTLLRSWQPILIGWTQGDSKLEVFSPLLLDYDCLPGVGFTLFNCIVIICFLCHCVLILYTLSPYFLCSFVTENPICLSGTFLWGQ